MGETQTFWSFIQEQAGKLLEQTLQHIGLTFISLLIAILIGVPLGILISRRTKLAGTVLGIAGVMQTIPSIALLGFMIPLFGIGPKPAIVALFLYALLPIIRNTYTGIINVDKHIKEAATGLGMSDRQTLFKVEMPLAMPVILAGIRIATVINVGVATLAAYIAAGGLGEFIFGGISLNNTNMILAGAIPAALLALLFDFLLSRLQHTTLKKGRVVFVMLPLILLLSAFYVLPSLGASGLLAGFTPEFMGRQDGYLGLKKTYGLHMRIVVISDAVMYKAAQEKHLDVISGYGTDGRIKAFDLVTLTDDKKIFPPYYCAPIVRKQTLEQYPELKNILELLTGRINDSVMTALNYKADYLHLPPEQIARDFLTAQGLYKPPRNGKKATIRIGSKIFAEQYILASMYTQLIKGYSDLDVQTKTGLGGTKICFDAMTNDQIDLYPEYTGTGLLVILQPAANKIDSLNQDKDAVYDFVQKEFQQRYQISWLQPIGFNNTYALMMRKEQTNALNIHSITDLVHYVDTN
ncbi:ABC transporter permease [Niastella yeongjuensis]|uniref:ABC transporter permease n=1 Tax=Niastella yeongjuensis TaxID=354355 RepID=A0A1V9E3R8_9BACT|nr:ABC transporter permease/substrate-binding protein [Niastella yeongjuensis]OQP40777.1 ABC transporter permease [Niastella yeongjuensis]SEP02010.1 osmoprotectant transport system permease protein [Niastella yeongjuensis]